MADKAERQLSQAIIDDCKKKLETELNWEGIGTHAPFFKNELDIMVPGFESSDWFFQRESINGIDSEPIMCDSLLHFKKKIGCILNLYHGNLEGPVRNGLFPIWFQEKKEPIYLCHPSEHIKYYKALLACAILLLKKDLPTIEKIRFGYASIQPENISEGKIADTINIFITQQAQKLCKPMPKDAAFSFEDPLIQKIIDDSFHDFCLMYHSSTSRYCTIM